MSIDLFAENCEALVHLLLDLGDGSSDRDLCNGRRLSRGVTDGGNGVRHELSRRKGVNFASSLRWGSFVAALVVGPKEDEMTKEFNCLAATPHCVHLRVETGKKGYVVVSVSWICLCVAVANDEDLVWLQQFVKCRCHPGLGCTSRQVRDDGGGSCLRTRWDEVACLGGNVGHGNCFLLDDRGVSEEVLLGGRVGDRDRAIRAVALRFGDSYNSRSWPL